MTDNDKLNSEYQEVSLHNSRRIRNGFQRRKGSLLSLPQRTLCAQLQGSRRSAQLACRAGPAWEVTPGVTGSGGTPRTRPRSVGTVWGQGWSQRCSVQHSTGTGWPSTGCSACTGRSWLLLQGGTAPCQTAGLQQAAPEVRATPTIAELHSKYV